MLKGRGSAQSPRSHRSELFEVAYYTRSTLAAGSTDPNGERRGRWQSESRPSLTHGEAAMSSTRIFIRRHGRRIAIALLTLSGMCAAHAANVGTDAWSSVDPRIGTGGDGHTFPGATVPFGMIQLSPDTAMPDFKHAYKWAAGYQYGDSSIMGFSHTHFSGSGHSDLGDVLLMPIAGEVRLEPGDPAKPGSGYRSRFSHDSEGALAGYNAVTLSV
jgi:putative alpha-1,2-mannosidase